MKIPGFPHLSCAIAILIICTACSQRFAVSINEQSIYDPRLNATAYRFADPGLQGCVNFALQQPGSVPQGLTVLACTGWEIESIEGIETLLALQFLDLSNNRVRGLAPLTGLKRLSSVSLSDNRVTDVTPLLSIATLTSAVLTGNAGIPCEQLSELQTRLGANLRRPEQCRD